MRGHWAWCAGRRKQVAAARERNGGVGVRGSRAQAQAGGRALGARQGAGRAVGRWARGRQGAGRAAGRALGARQAGAGRAGRAAGRCWARAAWLPGLALGSALGALGPFSIRFDLFFFLSHQMNTVHCKIKFFRKKNIY